jgi:hypothetical protein
MFIFVPVSNYYKYPRTYHLEWSPGLQNDDRRQEDYSEFIESEAGIVVSVKMDGENTNMYADKIHARSIDSKDHPTRHYVKGIWGSIRYRIPTGWRICGENLYGKHSIFYENLESYFQVFSVWDETNTCLDYGTTIEFCNELALVHVPVIYMGKYDEKLLRELPNTPAMDGHEGYVIRTYNSFKFEDFNKHVAKYVRKNHVQTDEHWMFQEVVPNKLKC